MAVPNGPLLALTEKAGGVPALAGEVVKAQVLQAERHHTGEDGHQQLHALKAEGERHRRTRGDTVGGHRGHRRHLERAQVARRQRQDADEVGQHEDEGGGPPAGAAQMEGVEHGHGGRELAMPASLEPRCTARPVGQCPGDVGGREHLVDVVEERRGLDELPVDGMRGDNAKPWLLAIVRNTCFSWLARNLPKKEQVVYEEELHALPDAEADPALLALRAEDRRHIDEAIERLPLEFREVVVLRELEDMSYKEIAIVLAIPIGTVMSRLARGRHLLARQLIDGHEAGHGL